MLNFGGATIWVSIHMPAYCTGYRTSPYFFAPQHSHVDSDALGVRNHFYRFCEDLIFTWIIYPLYFFQNDKDHRKATKHSCTMTGQVTLSWFSSLTCCGTVRGNCSSGITWSSSIFHLGWKDEIWPLDVQATLKVQKYKSNQNTNNSQPFKRVVVLLIQRNPAPVYIRYIVCI